MCRNLFFLLLVLPSCAPDIESSHWVCKQKEDCSPGWVCDKESSLCIRAWENQNGVYVDRLVLGSSQPMTGSQADLGNGMTCGIRTYLHHKNQIGGVWGRKIDLIVKDDTYNPDTALANVTALLEGEANERAFAIIGNGGTPTAARTYPYITETKKTIFFAPLTGANFLRQNPVNYYMFNMRASYAVEAGLIVTYYTEYGDTKLSADQIAVFAQCEENESKEFVPDSFGLQGIAGVAKALNVDQEALHILCYDKNTSSPDVAVETCSNWLETAGWVASASENDPADVGIVMIATPIPAANFINEIKNAIAAKKIANTSPYRKIGQIHCGIISPGGNNSTKALLEDYGTYDTIENDQPVERSYSEDTLFIAIVPAPWSMSDAAIDYRNHLDAYNPDLQPGFISFEGYLAAKLFVEGLEINGRDLTTDALVDSFESMTEYNLGIGAPIQFGPNDHEACESVWGFMLSSLDDEGKSSYQEVDLGP